MGIIYIMNVWEAEKVWKKNTYGIGPFSSRNKWKTTKHSMSVEMHSLFPFCK